MLAFLNVFFGLYQPVLYIVIGWVRLLALTSLQRSGADSRVRVIALDQANLPFRANEVRKQLLGFVWIAVLQSLRAAEIIIDPGSFFFTCFTRDGK